MKAKEEPREPNTIEEFLDRMGTLEGFAASLEAEWFFSWLDRARAKDRPALVRWLRLLRTDVIEGWFRGGIRTSGGSHANQYAGDEDVLALLLERHVLALDSRCDPARLIDFWRWATRDWPQVASLWQEVDLPGTLDAPTIPEQEERFGQALRHAADRIGEVLDLEWAQHTLDRLAAGRDSRRDVPPRARVVCAWDGPVPAAFRPGIVIDFRLLAEAAAGRPCNDPHVFDASFCKAFEWVRGRLGTAGLRFLEHDWGFLGPSQVSDTSGTMAIWLAQWLTAAGRFEEGCYWEVPPWVVVTASLDPMGPQPGGTAEPAGLLGPKQELLREEGVRVVAVADGTTPGPGRVTSWTPEAGHEVEAGLRFLSFSGGAEALAYRLRACLRPTSLGEKALTVKVAQWNWIDGYEGLPVRGIKITNTKRIDLSLLERAYFGGGHRWDSKRTPEGSVLCMVLRSSARPNTEEEYNTYFDSYNPLMLAALGAEVTVLDGLDRAKWEVQLRCDGQDEEQVRSLLEWVLTSHTEEVRRIHKLLQEGQGEAD